MALVVNPFTTIFYSFALTTSVFSRAVFNLYPRTIWSVASLVSYLFKTWLYCLVFMFEDLWCLFRRSAFAMCFVRLSCHWSDLNIMTPPINCQYFTCLVLAGDGRQLENELEYFVRECGRVVRLSRAQPEGPVGKSILHQLAVQLATYKKIAPRDWSALTVIYSSQRPWCCGWWMAVITYRQAMSLFICPPSVKNNNIPWLYSENARR